MSLVHVGSGWDRIFDALMFDVIQHGSSCTNRYAPYRTLEFNLGDKEYVVAVTDILNKPNGRTCVSVTAKDQENNKSTKLVENKRELYKFIGI